MERALSDDGRISVDSDTDGENLITEALKNVREDRIRLKKFCDTMEGILDNSEESIYSLAEPFAKLMDCLAKSNAQIVELTKVRKKAMQNVGFQEADNDALFREISDQG